MNKAPFDILNISKKQLLSNLCRDHDFTFQNTSRVTSAITEHERQVTVTFNGSCRSILRKKVRANRPWFLARERPVQTAIASFTCVANHTSET